MRWLANGFLERSAEVKRAEPDDVSQLGQGDLLVEVLLDVVARELAVPTRQPTSESVRLSTARGLGRVIFL